MNGRYYYATLTTDEYGNQICTGLIDTFGIIDRADYIQIDNYDMTLLGKMWTGSEWVANPNYVVPEVQPEIFE